jgi:hypothetical protein
MSQAHAIGSVIVLAAAAIFFAFALYSARTGAQGGILMRLRIGVVGLTAAQIALGVALYAKGERPDESLHILYGVAALAALPLAATFAFEAPPKARAGALAAGAGLMLAMIWRLWVTGGG